MRNLHIYILLNLQYYHETGRHNFILLEADSYPSPSRKQQNKNARKQKTEKKPVQFYKTRVFTLVTKKYFICCSFILRTGKKKHLHTHSNSDLCWCVMVKQVIILIILYGVSNRIFKNNNSTYGRI